ncbi:MAG: Asp-tRNA(Asn)/Glu-tRNA(Gln) amidotransferase subunit GatC [Agathobacter sp.]|nr:Asp-tRNA(Asn)/Glu-tRNA(Gln) amidotransferase subunit GatC [Agathobacter sp.]
MKHLGTQTLATDRLTLRRFTIEDVEPMYYNWASDETVTKYLSWQAHASMEVTEEVVKSWIDQYDNKEVYQWAIELNDLEQPIGSIGAVNVDDNIEAVEIGYCIGKEFWNQGYTTEALEEVIRFFTAEVCAARVWARHDVANPGSGKVMEKAGMKYEGTCLKAGRNNTGIVDISIYAKVISAAVLEEEPVQEEEGKSTVTKVQGEDGIWRNVITDETIEYVGILAKLELNDEEKEQAKKDMGEMLDYIDQLNELDTTGIEPMSHVFPVQNVFREDVVTNGDGSKATLANAPSMKDGGFKVPKTIGD